MRVLSGGEKVRVLFSRMMIEGSNVLIIDEPTDHLDMESITAVNNGMIKFPGVILLSCRDHQVVQTTANRIMEILPDGSMIDKITTYDEYLENADARKRQAVYSTTEDEENDDWSVGFPPIKKPKKAAPPKRELPFIYDPFFRLYDHLKYIS